MQGSLERQELGIDDDEISVLTKGISLLHSKPSENLLYRTCLELAKKSVDENKLKKYILDLISQLKDQMSAGDIDNLNNLATETLTKAYDDYETEAKLRIGEEEVSDLTDAIRLLKPGSNEKLYEVFFKLAEKNVDEKDLKAFVLVLINKLKGMSPIDIGEKINLAMETLTLAYDDYSHS